ncbi:MAG: ABC transporter ATP-binding protein [Gammaproteobacteria bacterium]|nr:ABC transporter ATP-binding protein [Gammaproteobacteria bacterium]
MPPVIDARDLTKRYGSVLAVDRACFSIEPGRIVGLIGPNGAGKTSILRAVLGLTRYEGNLRVLGRDPWRERAALMREAAFIPDVAVLPGWLRIDRAVDFVAAIHPHFRRERCRAMLAKTQIPLDRRVRELSKGLRTQVHLALAMGIDARLLVLDEPTIGLDLLARRAFYDALVEDFMDESRTILVTTHQVEEVEKLLTDVLFVNRGRIVLDGPIESLARRYAALSVDPARLAEARALGPFYERRTPGRTVLYYEDADRAALAALGDLQVPDVADLFVAKLSGGA